MMAAAGAVAYAAKQRCREVIPGKVWGVSTSQLDPVGAAGASPGESNEPERAQSLSISGSHQQLAAYVTPCSAGFPKSSRRLTFPLLLALFLQAPFVEGEAGAKWVCVDAGDGRDLRDPHPPPS